MKFKKSELLTALNAGCAGIVSECERTQHDSAANEFNRPFRLKQSQKVLETLREVIEQDQEIEVESNE
jgi:hypothetical protein